MLKYTVTKPPVSDMEGTISEEDDENSSVESPSLCLSTNSRSEMKKLSPRALLNPKLPSAESSFKEIPKEKSFKDVEALARALNKHFIFANLQMESRIRMISKMSLVRYDPGKIIFNQGEIGFNFYSIAKGRVEVIVDNNRVNILSTGESFGELALLHDFPRSATIKTLTSVYLWRIDREVFKNETKKIAMKNYEENQKFIEGVSIFNGLTPHQKSRLLESLSEFKFNSGQFIVREGEMGGICYFIKKGKVKCMKKGELLGEISEGKYFGENSLLSGNPRTASIVAVGEVRCIGLSKENLELALGNQLEQAILNNKKWRVIEKSEALKGLDKEINAKIVEISQTVRFDAGTVVFVAGESLGNNICMILEGQLVTSQGTWKNTYECVGDTEVLTNQDTCVETDIIAETSVTFAIISREEFHEIIGTKSQHFTVAEISRLKEVSIFKSLEHDKLLQLTELFSLEHFEDQNVIVAQNSPGDTFFLIKSGSVSILKDGVVLRVITKFDYFGERSLLFDEARTASVVASGKVDCWTLKRLDFFSCMNDTLQKRILNRIEMQDLDLKLSDLKFVRILGKGGYGTVFLVTDKKDKHCFALKVISKEKVEKFELSLYVNQEIKILQSLDNEFILKLVNNFEDSQYIYLLTEFIKGADLFTVIRTINNLSEEDSKFYFSCLLMIVEYLHDRNIIYRDFKPENIIVDEEGFPRLIDFGLAKISSERTFTVLGTPHYMAPEIILGQGYTHFVDYWSLGVMLYEFTFNKLPFGATENNPFSIYQSILNRDLNFVSLKQVSKDLKGLISQLLQVTPANRNLGGIGQLKMHPWLDCVDWKNLLYRNVSPPFVPSCDAECKGNEGVDLFALICKEMVDE